VTGRLEHFGRASDPRIWVRVANRLLDRIAAGEPGPGDLLPLVDDLRIDAGLRGHAPVSRALRALEERGVVRRLPGGAYRVVPETAAAVPVTPAQALLLEALRWAWAGLYQVTVSGGTCEAWRLDGTGSVHALTAEELREAIRADYAGYAAGV
jgi:DNA-binding transcriptional MocR family regulator